MKGYTRERGEGEEKRGKSFPFVLVELGGRDIFRLDSRLNRNGKKKVIRPAVRAGNEKEGVLSWLTRGKPFLRNVRREEKKEERKTNVEAFAGEPRNCGGGKTFLVFLLEGGA